MRWGQRTDPGDEKTAFYGKESDPLAAKACRLKLTIATFGGMVKSHFTRRASKGESIGPLESEEGMQKQIGILVIAVLIGLVSSGLMAAPQEHQPDYTVGDFAVSLTKMITAKPEITAEDAVEFLGHLGIELTGALDSEVSEATLVEAFGRISVRLTTSNPDRAVADQDADRLFVLFDRNDSLFSSELFKLCKGGAVNQNTPCLVDSDCDGGFCQELQSIRCQDGPNDGDTCTVNADCPDGSCKIPPGQAKKLDRASPSD